MKKIFKPYSYIETVKLNESFFKKYYFHSILDLNLVKLDFILKHGILCKRLIEESNFPAIYTHSARDFDSKNGSDFISLAEYTDKTEFSKIFESFTIHTLSCVSLLVDRQIKVTKEGERESFFDDEVFCYQAIPKSAIGGILLPEHLTNENIKNVCCLTSDFENYTESFLKSWINSMENYFGQAMNKERVFEKLKELHEIFGECSRPERWVGSCLEKQREKYGCDLIDVMAKELDCLWQVKLGVQEPKYIDVIDHINQESVPVYELGEKASKKIR